MENTITLNNKLIDHIQDSLEQDRKRFQTIDDIIAEAKKIQSHYLLIRIRLNILCKTKIRFCCYFVKIIHIG
uniref:Uncharacterized protein n=1 Tax=Lactobacillus johnsonii TaxID=33959 RepID=A0A9W3SMP3_LACJH|nr:hypothetical protein BBP16_09685 [Lactobacillus johnsonii]